MKRSESQTQEQIPFDAPAAVAVLTKPTLAPSPPPDRPAAPRDSPFSYGDYTHAERTLLLAISSGPFYGLVTGRSGTGKSSLVRHMEGRLDRHRHQMLYLSSSLASVLGVARFLAQALLVTPRRSHLETMKVVSDALKAQPAHVILWIDEADQVPCETLAEVRMLAECTLGIPQLFSVVLSGLPELKTLLDTRALFPLKRRITVHLALEGLRRDELEAFLVHRFGAKDACRVPASLHEELFERTQGTPALLSHVLWNALSRSGTEPLTDRLLKAAFDAAGL